LIHKWGSNLGVTVKRRNIKIGEKKRGQGERKKEPTVGLVAGRGKRRESGRC